MHQTKLITLLKILKAEDKELQKLEKYLKSGYINSNKEVLELFLYLKRYAPNYTSNRLKRTSVYKHLFSSLHNADKRLTKLAYLLKGLVENFLIQYDIAQNELQKKQLLLQALQQRNHPAFSEQSEQLIQEISTKESDSTKKYLDLYQLNYTRWSDVNLGKIGSEDLSFHEANKYLDKFYFLQKLKIIIEYKTLKSIRSVSFELPVYQQILSIADNHPVLINDLTVHLFLLTIKMLDASTIDNYYLLKETFIQSANKISKKNARDIFIALNNANSKLLGKTPQFSTKESFELYRFADANNLLIENNRIRDIEYNNFFKKDYSTVIKLLQPYDQVNNLAINLNIQIKTLTIRTFYDRWLQQRFQPIEEESVLLHLTHGFARFIDNHKKLSKNKQEGYIHFTRILNKLVKFSILIHPSALKLNKIKLELKNLPSVAFRNWLADKINFLNTNLPTITNG